MQKQRSIIISSLAILFVIIGINAYPQKKVTVTANDEPLSLILNQVAEKYEVRFAFDDDLLSQISTTVKVVNIDLEAFIKDICSKYGLNYRIIAGTYVFYVDNQKKIDDAIVATTQRKETKNIVVEPVPLKVVPVEHLLTGVVSNQKTGEKVKFSTIKINGSESFSTNEMGFFYATFTDNSELEISINHMGYEALDTTIVLSTPMLVELKLVPLPLLEPMTGMGVMRINFFVDLPDVPEMVAFNPTSTLKLPSVESSDLINALIVLPGINYLKGTDTGLSIRGGAPSDNLVLIDGIPMIESSHLMGTLSVLNAKYIQQAFVSRGGFGVEYGGRTSGIVDLTGKAGSSDRAEVDFTANLLHTNIYLGVPINEKSSLSGSFKKSFVDVWSRYLIENFALENKKIDVEGMLSDVADVDRTNINYTDANMKISIRPSGYSETTFNLFHSFDSEQRNYQFRGEGGFYQKNFSGSNTTGFSVNYKIQSKKGWLNTFSAGHNNMKSSSVSETGKQPDRIDQPVKTYFDADRINLREIMLTWKSELNQRYINHKFGAGYNYNFLDFFYEDHEVKITGANNFNDSISAIKTIPTANAYYQAELVPFSWLRFRAGTRGLYDVNKGLFSLQPRYGVEFIPAPNTKFYYSAGRYMQHIYLTYRFDSYNNVSPMWFIPEKRNQHLDAFHHIIGIKNENPKLMMNIEAYQKHNHGKVFFVGEKVRRGGFEVVDYTERVGEEVNRGIDLFVQYRSRIFKHLVSYSLSESFEKIDGINNNEMFYSFDHQLHRFRITEIASYRGWTASFNWYFANGTQYLLNTSDNKSLNFGLLPNFMQLDISLVKQIDFRYFYADIGVTVLNVLNHENQLSKRNLIIPEGNKRHVVQTTTTATSFSPLFYINLRYE